MSEYGKLLSQLDDTISTEEDIPGSSISFSIGDNSIRVKEKPKTIEVKEPDPPPVAPKKEQWWLKKPTVQLEAGNQKKEEEEPKVESPRSLHTTSSMRDFLDKEKKCKIDEVKAKEKENTIQDILASVDKYQTDLENATDEDIGSILEEMSKIAGAMSPIAESVKSRTISEILTEEERSVEELIQEAEKLVQKNNNDILKEALKTDISSSSENNTLKGLTKVTEFESNVIKMIDQQVSKSNNEKSEKRSASPSVEVLFQNIKTQKTLEIQNKKFDEQKAEVSSNSDLDDPIEKHSAEDVSEEKKVTDQKESLKKEITDVDKDFFDDLIKKTKESVEHLSSRSSSIDQEDFTNFLKLLQEQSEREGKDEFAELAKTSSLNLIIDQFDPLKDKSAQAGRTEGLEKELINTDTKRVTYESDCPTGRSVSPRLERPTEERKICSRSSSRDSSKRNSASGKGCVVETKKVVNDKNELYTVGLTPRLELFADAIPKLLAEKSNEEKRELERAKSEHEVSPRSDDSEDFTFKNLKALTKALKQTDIPETHKTVIDVRDYQESQVFDNQEDANDFNFLHDIPTPTESKRTVEHRRTERVISAPENRYPRNEPYIRNSRSYDQLTKSATKVVEPRKATTPVLSRKPFPPKPKIQPKTVTKQVPKKPIAPKARKDPPRPFPSDFAFDVKGSQIRYDEASRMSYGGGDWKGSSGLDTLEMLYQEERQRFIHAKSELEAEVETYKCKFKDVQMQHEQEMFSLKKQNIMLKARVDELTHMNKKALDARSKFDPKIMAMQKELERQENLIIAYESENKKLVQETKRLQTELKTSSQQKPKAIVIDGSSNQDALEKFKDLQEENVKFNIELSDLRQKNADYALKYEDATQQNSLLQEELDMIKDQLRAKNDFITDRLQTMTTNELELRKQVEDLRVELHSKTEQLKLIKIDYDRFQQSVEPLEKELIDLRARCSHYQEKLQTAKNNCEREKLLTQKLKDQVILDNKNIMDLNRQVREMERILKRKNPDSVSALILTANSENEKLNVEKVKLLEDRIAFLESEIRNKEDVAQIKLMDIQKKFTDMKDKYTTQVIELEEKLKAPLSSERKIYSEVGTQTMYRSLESRNSEPNLTEKLNGNKIGPKSQNLKEDAHLIATIRGLKIELANKEKIIGKVNKDMQELQKTNRKLQKEREKLLNERQKLEKANNKMMTSSDSKLASLKMTEGHDSNSNFYPTVPLANGKKSSSTQKLYDTTQYTDNSDMNNKLKKLMNENEVLKEELGRLNKDLMTLNNKRLQDLHLLQEEHDKEIDLIVKECNIKAGDTKALKLQGTVNSQMAMISHLKQQIEKLQDYKEQVIILKAERDHLETKNRVLNDKVKYLATPGSQQLQHLQDKIAILQQRHETRELSLQKLVRDLLRSRSQGCKDCNKGAIAGLSGDKGTQQLCYFRQELDNILGTLQDLTTP